MSDSTPKDVGDYYAKLFSGKAGSQYIESLVHHFDRQVLSYLLVESIKKAGNDPEEFVNALLGSWRVAIKGFQSQEAKVHGDMSQTVLGKMFSSTTGDVEDLRIFMKKTRDKAEELLRLQLDLVVAAVKEGGG